MKKNVLVAISGLQYEIDKDEAVEVISPGTYYKRGDKLYILYEELLEDIADKTKCTLEISNDKIDIIKRGANNVHMVFERNKKNTTLYQTPYGDLLIGIYTTLIKITEEEDRLIADVEYSLDINYAHVSDCQIQIKITSKKQA